MLRAFFCRSLLLALLLILPLSAAAQDRPSPEEARRFLEFYYNGEGVVLAEVQICTEVPREGERQYECVGEVAPDAVQTGTNYALRMVYVVPQDVDEETIIVQYNRGGVTREVDEVTVSGSIRYRTWTQFNLRQPGAWQFQILRDAGDDVETLHTLDVQASAGPEE